MNDRVTAVATVRWKCPGTQAVLWMTRLMLYEALVSPPIPPNMNRMPASSWAVTDGSLQGRARTQPIRPVPPRLRAAYSSEAITVNAVIIDGKNTE